jgi:opacity protein-like surface antigen
MKRMAISIAALSLATLVQAAPAVAQNRWGVELRGMGAISTQDAAQDTHENGAGAEANVQYRFLPHLAVYGGWSYTQFPALESLGGPDMDLEETGYLFGLRFEHPLREGSRLNGWVRTGATITHLELDDPEEGIVDDTGHGLGWEVGAGLALPFGGNWSVTPGVRYHALSRDLEIDGTTTEVDLKYVAFEVGISRRF